MIDVTGLPLMLLSIPCFDRRRAKPFPVSSSWYWLDWTELHPELVAEIAGACSQSPKGNPIRQPDLIHR